MKKPITITLSDFFTFYAAVGISIVKGIIVRRALGPEMKGQFTYLKIVPLLYGSLLLIGYQCGVLFYGLK